MNGANHRTIRGQSIICQLGTGENDFTMGKGHTVNASSEPLDSPRMFYGQEMTSEKRLYKRGRTPFPRERERDERDALDGATLCLVLV